MTTTRHSFHTVEILKDIKGRLQETIGVDVFCEDRPLNNSKQRPEMLVISLPYSIRQREVYQSSYLRIEILVKDKSEGVTNIARLEEISNQIIEMFPIKAEDGRWYTLRHPALVLQGKDTIGYTRWYMQTPIIINKTDTYNI